jgi:hypothetical protein
MLEQLRANLGTHLKFYRRNRLLLVLALLFALLAGLSITFSLIFSSTTGRFEIVHGVVSQLDNFAFVLVGALGLFLVSSHLRNRSLKMVLTKPCLPETYLASVFLSAAVVGALLYAAILSFGLILCGFWKIPIQSGFFFITAESLLQALIVMAYLAFLSFVMHPVPAVLIALLLNEGIFYQLRFALLTAIKNTGGNPLLPAVEKVTFLLYMILPMYQPYSEKTESVHESLRTTTADWGTLGQVALYTLAITGLCYCLSDLALRRKNLM